MPAAEVLAWSEVGRPRDLTRLHAGPATVLADMLNSDEHCLAWSTRAGGNGSTYTHDASMTRPGYGGQ